MSYEDEIQRLTKIERIKSSYFDMDEAFCARMHAAITAGLESAPTAVVATPGTKRPKYVSDLTARYHLRRNERWLSGSGNSRAIPVNLHSHHFIIRATQFGPVSKF
jgi:hypothetical protein